MQTHNFCSSSQNYATPGQRMQKHRLCNELHNYANCSIAHLSRTDRADIAQKSLQPQRYLSNTYSHASSSPPCSVAKSDFCANKNHQMSRDSRVRDQTSTSRIDFCTDSYASRLLTHKKCIPKTQPAVAANFKCTGNWISRVTINQSQHVHET